MEAGRQIMLVAQKAAGKDEPKPDDMFEVGCVSSHPADAQAARRHREGAGRGHAARQHPRHHRQRRVLRLRGHAGAARGRDQARGRGAAPRGDAAVRPVRQAQQEDPARDPDLDRRHRRRRPPGRHDRRAPAAQAREQAVGARPVRHRQAAREAARAARARGRHPAGREAHPRPRQAPDGEEPARVLPERAGQGDPEGARRRRRRRRHGGAREEDHRRQAAQGSAQEGRRRVQEAQADVADVGRSDGRAQLHRHAGQPALVEEDQDQARPGIRRAGARTRTTTASTRSRTASSSTSRCSSASTRSSRRSSAWSGLRASARPRSARAWRARPAASSCAWRSAACATRPRSAAIAAPTSARCRARCCRA